MKIQIEKNAIVVCLGATGTGKSTFVSKKFPPHYIISSDELRQRMWGDWRDQTHNKATFEILFATLEARAKAKVLTVVDSTGTQSVLDRAKSCAQQYKLPLHLFVFPALEPGDLTKERMKHRWSNMGVYDSQVRRISNAKIDKEYKVHPIPYSNEARDAVEIEFTSEFDDENEFHRTKELDPKFKYMVVPDLHGEVWAIKQARGWLFEDTTTHRLIQLGDINDRGESTYQTFMCVYNLWKEGLLFGVLGNHDAKFARWIQKYLKSDDVNTEYLLPVPNFEMTLSHGLMGTLEEFCTMFPDARNEYAHKFLEYTQHAPYALKLTLGTSIYYFAHAGLSPAAIMGTYVDEHDKNICIYDSVLDGFRAKELFEGQYGDKIVNGEVQNVWFVNGHTFGRLSHREDVEVRQTSEGYGLIACDVGIGKRKFETTPKFLTIMGNVT